MSSLVLVAPQPEYQIPYHPYFLRFHHLLTKRINYFKDKLHSVGKWRNLIAKCQPNHWLWAFHYTWMYSLSISSLASNEIDRFACATNRACGTCWVRACALASDCTHLIEAPVVPHNELKHISRVCNKQKEGVLNGLEFTLTVQTKITVYN